ncbi:hypothetical protein NLX71_06950 [Paenibacillus sp. MZ04-78.2]|uniref:hypothetical protein n=1 Tax=Paenibacillus sp. MZ04-78.2 TaxID=2962034 RepID=UPI0020B69EE5|nr:hypothetical protein [Paenibacillus sp. MZ04-78.2]MCP3773057.1 hypothetical protein [Paenibacillus sp. MZ04-78.2]
MGLLYELIRQRNLSLAGSIADRSIPVRPQSQPEELVRFIHTEDIGSNVGRRKGSGDFARAPERQ